MPSPPVYLALTLPSVESQAVPPPIDPATGLDFFAAFVAWWKAEPTLTELVPGGLLNARAPASVVIPFARMVDVDPNVQASTDDMEMDVYLYLHATGDAAVKALARCVIRLVLDTTARPALRFADEYGAIWREYWVRRSGTGTFGEVATNPDGSILWRYDQPFRFSARREAND